MANPKTALGLFPTPMYKLANISADLGTNIWIKRDDLSGVLLGGNTIRKLEYVLADAKKQGYATVMTSGSIHSNDVSLTAACAEKLGLSCILVLKTGGIAQEKGNLLLDKLTGVKIIFVDSESDEDVKAEMKRIEKESKKPIYVIPGTATLPLGALGYVDAMREIAKERVHFDALFEALGSGATAAGTILGCSLYMPYTRVSCVKIAEGPFEKSLPALIQKTANLMGVRVIKQALDILDMTKDGLFTPSKEGNDAIDYMLKKEGILLDPLYTGKAFAGLLRRVKEGRFRKSDNVLFLHTGGTAELFASDAQNASAH